MLNSFIGHSMEEAVTSNPNNQRLKPTSILLYNKKMCSVDESDKCLAPYGSVRRSWKWYKKYFFHLVDLAVYNSFLVFKILQPNVKITYKEFVRRIVQEILIQFPVQRKPKGRRATDAHPTSCRLSGTHFPGQILRGNGKVSRSDCIYCKLNGMRRQTPFQCKTCKVRLCVTGEKSCFENYHSRPHLPKVCNITLCINLFSIWETVLNHNFYFRKESLQIINPMWLRTQNPPPPQVLEF